MTTKRTSETAITERVPRQPQLLLITDSTSTNGADSDSRWTLDEETRETGRRGLAKARAALHATRPLHLDAAA